MYFKRKAAGVARKTAQKFFDLRYHETPPALDQVDQRLDFARSQIQDAHDDYIVNVSSPRMAASLELSSILYYLCEAVKPKVIIDLGSGFTSYVFRLYQASADEPVTIYSVDDNVEWLEKTREFMSKYHLPSDHLIDWETFRARTDIERADLVFHDLATMPMRVSVLDELGRYAHDKTYLVLDDVHREILREAAKEFIRQKDLRYCSLKPWTADQFGRFSWMMFNFPQP